MVWETCCKNTKTCNPKSIQATNEEREIIRQDRRAPRARRHKANSFVWSHLFSWLSQSWDKRVLHCLEESFVSKGRVIFPWLKKSSFLSHFSEILGPNFCTTVTVVNRAVNTKSPLSVKFYKISMNDNQNAVMSPLPYLWAHHLVCYIVCHKLLKHKTSQGSQIYTTELNCHWKLGYLSSFYVEVVWIC